MKREGWYDPEEKEFTVPVHMEAKEFVCGGGCGVIWRVTPKINSTGRYWDFELNCAHCKHTSVMRYHAWRRPNATEKKEQKATRSVLPPEED